MTLLETANARIITYQTRLALAEGIIEEQKERIEDLENQKRFAYDKHLAIMNQEAIRYAKLESALAVAKSEISDYAHDLEQSEKSFLSYRLQSLANVESMQAVIDSQYAEIQVLKGG